MVERLQNAISYRQSKFKKSFAVEKRDVVKSLIETKLAAKREEEIRATVLAEQQVEAAAAANAAAEKTAAEKAAKGILGYFI